MFTKECTKIIRELSQGTLTTDLHKTTKADGAIVVQLELQFVRNSDKKVFSSIESDDMLRGISMLSDNAMLITNWLPNVEYAIPLTRECVVIFSYKHPSAFKTKPDLIMFTLTEDDETASSELLEAKVAELGSELDDLKQKYVLCKAKLDSYAAMDTDLAAILARFDREFKDADFEYVNAFKLIITCIEKLLHLERLRLDDERTFRKSSQKEEMAKALLRELTNDDNGANEPAAKRSRID